MRPADRQQFQALIIGGGVAGLEAALALRDLGGQNVATTLLCPEREFVYRPLRVREPFAGPTARHYPLDEIAREIGLQLERDKFKWLDSETRVVHTESGVQLSYDALLLALGARKYPRFKHALTLDDRDLDDQLHGLIQDLEAGYIRRLAFVIPSRTSWPLPLYEIALMTARRAWEMSQEVDLTLVTPEDSPLELFGDAASEAVARVLAKQRIHTILSTHCESARPGELSLHPGDTHLRADRIIALPELVGPATPGVPKRDPHGFVPIDAYCRVPGFEHVFAAGDCSDFAVKHGSVAAQQADIAAEGIAALAGAPVTPTKLKAMIYGILLGAERPLYLSTRVSGERGSSSEASEKPSWSPETKIVAKYLSPYLASRDQSALP